MPSVEKHCKISKERTKDEYRRLHRWMDLFDGRNHRTKNHNLGDLKYLRKNWKKYGRTEIGVIREFLHHIVLDWQDTERKWNKY